MADVQGVPVGVLQAALQHGEHQLVAVLDDSGHIAFSNDGFRSIGFEPGEVNGRLGLDFVHPDDLDRALAGITTLFETGTSVPTQFRMRKADGGYKEFDVASTLVDYGGRSWMVVDFRPIPLHVVTATTLSALARGEPPEQALGALAEALTRIEVLDCVVGFALDDDHGDRRTVGPLHPMMVGGGSAGAASAGEGDDRRAATPWARAEAAGGTVVCDDLSSIATVAPAVHEEAQRLGLVAATFSCVPDPASVRPALAALWYRSAVRKVFLDLYFEEFALDLARLALQGRHERRQLEHLARHDQLTGLVNRATFLAALEHHLEGAPADEEHQSLAVIYLDLDDFKPVNDTHGHAAGDQVLEAVAHRFVHIVRPGDLVARLGGDEFAVLCPGLGSRTDAEDVARRLVHAAGEPVAAEGAVVRVGASAGVAFVPATGALERGSVLRAADDALYRAKRTGKGTVVAHDP